MDTRTVAANRGWQWIVEGFRMFRLRPLNWIVLVTVMVLISLTSAMIPLLGALAVNLVSPIFFAGLMTACRTSDLGGEPKLEQLFSAFKTHAAPLVTVGGIYLAGNIIAAGIMIVMIGGAAMPMLLGKGPVDPETIRAAMPSILLGVGVGLAAFLPVLMAVWFAPLLIVFHDIPPVEAMKRSVAACWQNTLPFFVYGAIGLILMFAAFLPLMLGFIVLLPVLVCSIYASYKDIFPTATEPRQSDVPTV